MLDRRWIGVFAITFAACGGTVEVDWSAADSGASEGSDDAGGSAGSSGTAGAGLAGAAGGYAPDGAPGAGGAAPDAMLDAVLDSLSEDGPWADVVPDVPPDVPPDLPPDVLPDAAPDAPYEAADGGPVLTCARTTDPQEVFLLLADGTEISCSKPLNGATAELTGSLTTFSPAPGLAVKLHINTCPPDANCVTQDVVKLTSTGLTASIPEGAFVHVAAQAYHSPLGCVQRLFVTNVPVWEGHVNPVSSSPHVWIAAADGAVAPLGTAPFEVQMQYLPCPGDPGATCGGYKIGNYALQFSASSSTALWIGMGDPPSPWTFEHDGVKQSLFVRVSRSFIGADCGGLSNFGWAAWR